MRFKVRSKWGVGISSRWNLNPDKIMGVLVGAQIRLSNRWQQLLKLSSTVRRPKPQLSARLKSPLSSYNLALMTKSGLI